MEHVSTVQWENAILRGKCEERRAQKEGKRKDERGEKEGRGEGEGKAMKV